MTIRLRPMRDDELPRHIERARADYARDIESSGGIARDEAEAKAKRDIDAAFPGGRPAEGHQLRVIEEAATSASVGRIHYAERPAGSGRAWVYDIAIDEQLRGRGLGRQAMLLLEEELRSRGFSEVALNVFGGNERARALYRSLGYREVAVDMAKELEPAPASEALPSHRATPVPDARE